MNVKPTFLHAAAMLLAVATGSCTSAEEIMRDGVELEAKGSYDEAAWKYIRALRKDEGLIDAREHLQWVGDTLVTIYLDRSSKSTDFGRPVNAAEPFLDIDRLASGAMDVGIQIRLPEDYGTRRRETLDAAIFDLQNRAEASQAGRRLKEANDLLVDAVERFDPEPPLRDQLLVARFHVLVSWANDLSATGRFREAVHQADEALAIAQTVSLDPTPAMERRNAAMEAGTVYVAATPVWRSGRHERARAPALLSDLNDRLDLDYWSNPPEFITFVHPALVRRRLRQLDLDHESLSAREARIIARDLNADFAVVAEIDRLDVTEKDVRRKEKQARTRNGRDAVYVEVRGEVEIGVRLSFAIVDRDGDTVRKDEFEERRSADFKRAEYDGDYRDLDVSRGTRQMFEADHYDESVEQAEEQLAQRLAERFGRIVFDQVLSRVR